MKKFLTLVLALVLVFGLTVPAMAFTSDTSEDVDHPYDLKIYLVEYDNNDLFGIVALPESDRGYAKNEIVAAVVELSVPDDEEIKTAEYANLVFGGDNVDLDVKDNYTGSNIDLSTAGVEAGNVDAAVLTDDEIVIGINSLKGEETFKWLFFAKVTDDEASLYAKLVDGTGSVGFATTSTAAPAAIDEDLVKAERLIVTLGGDPYTIWFGVDAGDGDYVYVIQGGDEDIIIYTDDDYKSTGMSIGGENLGVNTKGELGIVEGATINTDEDDIGDIMDVYNDVVVDVFGMDYFKIGNYVRESFFEDLVSADTIVATVDIEPWTAYVTVPDNIVVDPPKTGDAASIMGFVMVALSGAGVVALRKRG